MNFLVDTHSLIWYLEGDKKLSSDAINTIKNPDFKISISIASFWEIAIKISIRKLLLNQSLLQVINKTSEQQINVIPIQAQYLLNVVELPFHHKDPFDRLIIATAIAENLPIISSDENFDNYGIKRIW